MLSILKMPPNSQNWGFEHLFWALCRGRRRGRNRAMNDPLEAVKLDPVVGLKIDPVGGGDLLNSTPGEEKNLGGGGRCGRGGDGTWAGPPPRFSEPKPAGDSLLPPAS